MGTPCPPQARPLRPALLLSPTPPQPAPPPAYAARCSAWGLPPGLQPRLLRGLTSDAALRGLLLGQARRSPAWTSTPFGRSDEPGPGLPRQPRQALSHVAPAPRGLPCLSLPTAQDSCLFAVHWASVLDPRPPLATAPFSSQTVLP